MPTVTTTGGTVGWSVTGDPLVLDATGNPIPQGFKWSAFSPFGGSWGYENTQDAARERAQQEFARLMGED